MKTKRNTPLGWVALLAMISLAVGVIAAQTQNEVPPTAVQAAQMPQFAPRLAPLSKRPPSPASARGRLRPGPRDSNGIYDNGPINGNTDAWTINFGYIVSDSFTVANGNGTVIGMSFGAWLYPGDTLTSAQISITSSPFGGTTYFNSVVNFTQSGCVTNEYGYDVCLETSSAFNGPALNNGTYWVNLQNASVPSGDPVYWDENSGVGCNSPGCPSQADESSVGTIPSESFTILGQVTTTTTTTTSTVFESCPDPQNGFHDLYDFPAGSGPSGVVLGGAGKLYGTLANAGSHGAGLVFDLADAAARWLFSSLYSFLGGSNGSSPSGVIVGPQGALYGSAEGGYGYGLIYKATPPPTACATALCSWNETPIYEFTSDTDAEGGTVTAFDSAGNLYGISTYGGAYGAGTVFELSPSQGGWTERILYSFTGGSDGGLPNSLLLDLDGNLYGTAAGGNSGCDNGLVQCGVVFQLVPSGAGWTENVIYAFTGGADGWGPGGLIQDEGGGLCGFAVCATIGQGECDPEGNMAEGVIFQVGNGGIYQISQYRGEACSGSDFVSYQALAFDGAGNLYAVDGGGLYYKCGAVVNIFAETQLVGGYYPIFGNLTSDANGNLYGTVSTCGFGNPQRTDGMVWQYSP